MSKSPLLRLNIIPFDQDPWDDDFNENTSILDSVVGQFMSPINMQGIWKNAIPYLISQQVVDAVDGSLWICNAAHTSADAPTLFADDRIANPSFWTQTGSSAASYAAAAASSAATAAAAAALQVANVGRNLFHNPLFRVQQRGNGPWTTSGSYTADRWFLTRGSGGGTNNVNIQSISDGGRAAIGDEEATFILQANVAGGSAAGDLDLITQRIENVRRLAGKTVTVSFFANSGTTPKVGINATQIFGTGGSPSANVQVLATGRAIPISTAWARYSATFAIPSVSGKTFGTTPGTDYTAIQFWLSSGATSNAVSGNIGVQTALFNFWGLQVEIAPSATPLEKPDPQQDLAKCQRFFCSSFNAGITPAQNAGTNTGELCFFASFAGVANDRSQSFPFPVQMRAIPIVTTYNPAAANAQIRDFSAAVDCSGTNIGATDHSVRFVASGNASTSVTNLLGVHFTASADL